MSKFESIAPFIEKVDQFKTTVSRSQPIPNNTLFQSLRKLTQEASKSVMDDKEKLNKVARVLVDVFTDIDEIKVDPPITPEQDSEILGRVATFRTLVEVTTPKPPLPPRNEIYDYLKTI